MTFDRNCNLTNNPKFIFNRKDIDEKVSSFRKRPIYIMRPKKSYPNKTFFTFYHNVESMKIFLYKSMLWLQLGICPVSRRRHRPELYPVICINQEDHGKGQRAPPLLCKLSPTPLLEGAPLDFENRA